MIGRNILWGVWNKRSAVHLCIVTTEGLPHEPHVLAIDCACGPILDYTDEHMPIVIHDVFENEVG